MIQKKQPNYQDPLFQRLKIHALRLQPRRTMKLSAAFFRMYQNLYKQEILRPVGYVQALLYRGVACLQCRGEFIPDLGGSTFTFGVDIYDWYPAEKSCLLAEYQRVADYQVV